MSRCLFLLAALLVTSCGPTWEQRPVIVSATGERLCVKHKVPLVTVAGFTAPAGYVPPEFPYTDAYRLYRILPYPNRIPNTQFLKRNSIATIPVKITYCPKCEQEYNEALDTII